MMDAPPFDPDSAIIWSHVDHGLVWKPIHPYNYYHFLLENGPLLHDHMCR